jgi:alkanesulfonate monooxygenase SsuD/methylene tetrahydromethanopterin reductase-like flavin-dependent oxidoreductase (luciferase family)
MRVGLTIFCQNTGDWDRYEAEERGEDVAARPSKADAEIFREEVGLALMADNLGFDSVWTVEHHFTPYTMVTNPLQLLTYLSGVTKNVDLGSMVVVLPWHNPVRVAEDVAMLDMLLGPDRQIMCGVGRGLGRREYDGMNIDQAEARGRFDEGIEILQELLATGRTSFKGEFWQLDDVHLRPQPERDLSPQLFCAGGTSETTQVIAKHNISPLAVPTTSVETALKGARNFANLRYEAGFAPVHNKLSLWTYCSDDPAEVEEAHGWVVDYSDTALRHYELAGTHLDNVKGYETYAKNAANVRADPEAFRKNFVQDHPLGNPDEVIAQTRYLAETFGASEIMFAFKYGNMPIERAERSLQMFAREVLPALKEIDAAPLQPEAAHSAG